MVLKFLYIVEGGGPLVNVFLRVYFDDCRQRSRYNFRPLKQRPYYVFGVFVDSRFEKVCVLNFPHVNRVCSMVIEF